MSVTAVGFYADTEEVFVDTFPDVRTAEIHCNSLGVSIVAVLSGDCDVVFALECVKHPL